MTNLKKFINQTIELWNSKTMKSLSIVFSANTIHAGLGFFITIIALRGLTAETIGVLFPLISLVLMVKQISDFGLNTAFIKMASLDRSAEPLLFRCFFWLKMATALIVSIFGFIYAAQIGVLLFNDSNYDNWVRLAFILTFFQIISIYFQTTLQLKGHFKQLAISKIIPQLLKLIGLTWLLFFSKMSLENTFLFYMGIPVVVLFLSINRENLAPLSQKPSFKVIPSMFSVGKWIWLAMVANAGISHLDILMTRSMAGPDEVSRLIAGQRLASVIPLITSSLVLVLLPKVSSMPSIDELRYFLRKATPYSLIFSMLILILIPITPWVINLLLGPEYADSATILNIYLVANAIDLIITPLSLVLYRVNQEPFFAYLALVQLAINSLGNYFFIPLYGATASASITLSCKIIAFIIIIFALKKHKLISLRQ